MTGSDAQPLDPKEVAVLRSRFRDLAERVDAAHHHVAARRFAAAEATLAPAVSTAQQFAASESFALFRLLGRCARAGHRFAEAREHYGWALAIAEHIGGSSPRGAGELLTLALSGLAAVAAEEGDLLLAGETYADVVELAREYSDSRGLAAELQAHGMVLYRLRDDRAEGLLREALAQPGLELRERAIILDNLSTELSRQGRVDDAVRECEHAVALFGEAGDDHERFVALLNLSALARHSDPGKSTAAFVTAYELIHRLRARIDARHYTEGYARAIEAINAESERRARDPDRPSLSHPAFDAMLAKMVAGLDAGPDGPFSVAGLRYAAARVAAEHIQKEALQLLLDHRYFDAEDKLRFAELAWENLGARHELPDVWSLLGQVHLATGRPEEARALLDRALSQARELGDARAEFSALISMIPLAEENSPVDVPLLDLLAQARALQSFLQRFSRGSVEGGALDQIEYALCHFHGADDLAEQCLRRAIAAVRPHIAQPRMRQVLATRLSSLLELLTDLDRLDEALTVRDELLSMDIRDPALAYTIHSTIAILDFRSGQRTEQTMQRFRDGCAAFEEMHPGALDIGAADHLAARAAGHYSAAAELALHLDHHAEAFELLERAKSRALLHQLGDQPTAAVPDDPRFAEEAELWQEVRHLRTSAILADTPNGMARAFLDRTERLVSTRRRLAELWDQMASDFPHVRAHRAAEPITLAEVTAALGDSALVEFFVARQAIHAFVVRDGAITVEVVADRDDPGLADLDRHIAGADLGPVLRNPLYVRLSRVVDTAARGGPVYVVPHERLHLLPLHLAAGEPRPRTVVLPSASVLRVGRVRARRSGVTVVAGDPIGDLPFARGECLHAASARKAAPPRFGAEVTLRWLSETLAEQSVELVHLACHGVFNEINPARSGLVLAGPNGPSLATLSDLAGLNWSGTVVVLSACNTGVHRVRTGDELAGLGRTLLGAGAAALVTSLRSVPDLATALLMTWFHEYLDTLDHISAAVSAAQQRLRDATAADLIAWAARAPHCDARTTLACRVTAAAHRAAGDIDAYVTWQDAVTRSRRGDHPSGTAWSQSTRTANRPEYQVRPFAEPSNWASFTVFGAG